MGTELRKFSKLDTEDGRRVREALEAGLKAPTEYIVKLTELFLAEHSNKKSSSIVLSEVLSKMMHSKLHGEISMYSGSI